MKQHAARDFDRAKDRIAGDFKAMITDGEELLKAAATVSGEGKRRGGGPLRARQSLVCRRHRDRRRSRARLSGRQALGKRRRPDKAAPA
jgi:hypothetical protein